MSSDPSSSLCTMHRSAQIRHPTQIRGLKHKRLTNVLTFHECLYCLNFKLTNSMLTDHFFLIFSYGKHLFCNSDSRLSRMTLKIWNRKWTRPDNWTSKFCDSSARKFFSFFVLCCLAFLNIWDFQSITVVDFKFIPRISDTFNKTVTSQLILRNQPFAIFGWQHWILRAKNAKLN